MVANRLNIKHFVMTIDCNWLTEIELQSVFVNRYGTQKSRFNVIDNRLVYRILRARCTACRVFSLSPVGRRFVGIANIDSLKRVAARSLQVVGKPTLLVIGLANGVGTILANGDAARLRQCWHFANIQHVAIFCKIRFVARFGQDGITFGGNQAIVNVEEFVANDNIVVNQINVERTAVVEFNPFIFRQSRRWFRCGHNLANHQIVKRGWMVNELYRSVFHYVTAFIGKIGNADFVRCIGAVWRVENKR